MIRAWLGRLRLAPQRRNPKRDRASNAWGPRQASERGEQRRAAAAISGARDFLTCHRALGLTLRRVGCDWSAPILSIEGVATTGAGPVWKPPSSPLSRAERYGQSVTHKRATMLEMTLEEVEQAAAKIETLARVLADTPTPENAKSLRGTCDHYRSQMQGRFGNVGEQLVRISDAARLFEISRIDWTRARIDLHQAVTRMNGAIRIHRRA